MTTKLRGRLASRNPRAGHQIRKASPTSKAQGEAKEAAIVDALIQMATKGRSESNRLAAAKLILAYLDGAPSQKPAPKKDNKIEVTYT